MQLCTLLGIPPMIAGPGTSAAAANNLAWVQYINNNTSHTDWTLDHFKIGNEVWGCGGNQDEATYEANYNANYAMLSTPVNGKKLNIVAGTDLIGKWPWLDTMLKNIGARSTGSSSTTTSITPTTSRTSASPTRSITTSSMPPTKANRSADRSGRLVPRQVRRGEAHQDLRGRAGDWLQNFTASDDWLQQGTLMDAISGAETLHLFMQHADRFAVGGARAGHQCHSLALADEEHRQRAGEDPHVLRVRDVPAPPPRDAKWAPNTLTSENISGNGQTSRCCRPGPRSTTRGASTSAWPTSTWSNTRTIKVTVNSAKSAYAVTTAQVLTGPAKDSYNDYAVTEKVNIQALGGSSCSISGKTLRSRCRRRAS